ncbi:MAG: hypothetical protein JWP75_1367 [Frondihabitans sp.]|nr:hypothetical protein [Frondihabitans sp.]
MVANAARAALAEVYLTIVSPTWPWGYLRVAGLALITEGLFLMLVSVSVPVGGLALLSLLVGEGAFVASFAPGVRLRGSRPARETRSAPPTDQLPALWTVTPGADLARLCTVDRRHPRCRREPPRRR